MKNIAASSRAFIIQTGTGFVLREQVTVEAAAGTQPTSVLASLHMVNPTAKSTQVENHARAPRNHVKDKMHRSVTQEAPNDLRLWKKAVSPEKELPFYIKGKEAGGKHNFMSYLE